MDHKTIPDSERHEVKGASVATVGQFLKCVGIDETAFASITVADIADFPVIPEVPVAANQTDSTASTVEDLVEDFNSLLAKLKASGLMES